jgi:hypothetical protein
MEFVCQQMENTNNVNAKKEDVEYNPEAIISQITRSYQASAANDIRAIHKKEWRIRNS